MDRFAQQVLTSVQAYICASGLLCNCWPVFNMSFARRVVPHKGRGEKFHHRMGAGRRCDDAGPAP